MTVETYIAMLHQGAVPTSEGQPVQCPYQPDGAPKPEIDYLGTIYRIIDVTSGSGVFDYTRATDV